MPVRLSIFAGLAQSEERPPCKGQARCSIPCTEHHFARLAHSAERRLGKTVAGTEARASAAPVVQSAETRRSDRRWWVFESPSEHQSRVQPERRGGGFKFRKVEVEILVRAPCR